MSEGFLNKAYGARDASGTRTLYDRWAANYEAEIGENGYATPTRCAAALAAVMPDKTLPVLDFGCGTGLSGLALQRVGFQTIDGLDLSEQMLDRAAHKGIYRSLARIEADSTLAHAAGNYAAIAAVGVIGVGAAPVAVLDTLMEALDAGGFLVFSFNDHALEDPVYEARIKSWTDGNRANLLFQEHGPHLPGINLNSTVYVIEKN
jgi:predicted TPR repeat methyltransferase